MEAISSTEHAMREREATYNVRVPADQWIILRLDGRGFSGLTEKHFAKPFDPAFHGLMLRAAEAVFIELDARLALVGSDEISLVLSPAWQTFDRRVEKILSLAASIVTCAFVQESRIPAQFDCRVQTTELRAQVARYVQWRLADIERNARATCAYWTLRADGLSARAATTRLMHAGRGEQEQILQAHSLDFASLPAWQRQGAGIVWKSYEKPGYDPIRAVEVTALRRRSMLVEIPQPDEACLAWLQAVLDQPDSRNPDGDGADSPAPKYDGKLDEQGDYTASLWENGVDIDRPSQHVELSPAQALSLRDWLIQKSSTLESMAKEQEA